MQKATWKGVLVGVLTGTAVGMAGFFLAQEPGPAHSMGIVMFCLVPFASGMTIAMVSSPKGSAAAAGLISLVACLGLLLATGKEGALCTLLAFPLLLVPMMIGVAVGHWIRRASKRLPNNGTPLNLSILGLMPLLVFAGHRVEMKNLAGPRTETVTTTVHLNAAPADVWMQIHSLPAVGGKKPLLMYFGLPIPQRCVLRGEGVGGKRMCYFNQGWIEETVLEWDPPRKMRLSIDRTNMPGRHWLEFEDAEYDLVPEASGTRLTRSTTIQSNLFPSWYWQRFELLGVEDEHEYLFSDLPRRF